MTNSTDTKNIGAMVEAILVANKIVDAEGHALLKPKIDLVSAFVRYVNARDAGEKPADARARVAEEYNFGANPETSARARMCQLLMDTLGVDVNENNDDWQAVITHCIDAEKKGETITMFRAWMNADPYNSPKKHQIAQSPMIIQKVWRSAFEKAPKVEEPKRDPIPERVRTLRPDNVPAPKIKRG